MKMNFKFELEQNVFYINYNNEVKSFTIKERSIIENDNSLKVIYSSEELYGIGIINKLEKDIYETREECESICNKKNNKPIKINAEFKYDINDVVYTIFKQTYYPYELYIHCDTIERLNWEKKKDESINITYSFRTVVGKYNENSLYRTEKEAKEALEKIINLNNND